MFEFQSVMPFPETRASYCFKAMKKQTRGTMFLRSNKVKNKLSSPWFKLDRNGIIPEPDLIAIRTEQIEAIYLISKRIGITSLLSQSDIRKANIINLEQAIGNIYPVIHWSRSLINHKSKKSICLTGVIEHDSTELICLISKTNAGMFAFVYIRYNNKSDITDYPIAAFKKV